MSIEPKALCPFCGRAMVRRHHLPHIWHRPPGTSSYSIAWCNACRYGALVPRPTADELRACYDPHYFDRYAGESPEGNQGPGSAPPRLASFFDRLRVHLAWRADRSQYVDIPWIHAMLGARPARICDIGCGNGDVLVGLRDLGHQVVGIEVDPRAVERARARGLEIHPGTAEEPPAAVPLGQWDAVVMTHVLEHCPDPIRAIQNAAALLTPGGALFVEVPNNDSLAASWSGPCWYHCDAGRHLNFFTPASLEAIVRQAGLTPTRHVFSGYCATFQNERVAAEQAVFDRLYDTPEDGLRAGVSRPRVGRLWADFARSVWAPPQRKYEVMGLMARSDLPRASASP